MAKKSPVASGKKTAAKKVAPKTFGLSDEDATEAVDLAKGINDNFNSGDDEQAQAAMRLLQVLNMFAEGRAGNALFGALARATLKPPMPISKPTGKS